MNEAVSRTNETLLPSKSSNQIPTSSLSYLFLTSSWILLFGVVRYGWLIGLRSLVSWMVIGYFFGDITVATAHFIIDNYKPDDPGYMHHIRVAQTGFFDFDDDKPASLSKSKQSEQNECENTSSSFPPHSKLPSTVPCAPCGPCTPIVCRPQCRPNTASMMSTNDTSSSSRSARESWFHITGGCWVAIWMSPLIIPWYPGVGMIFVMYKLLNLIAGAGIPDYYAHRHHQAPFWVWLAQQLHLMMTPYEHEQHHKNPRTGYCYFSPISNFVLDGLKFWDGMERIVSWKTGQKAITVPAAI